MSDKKVAGFDELLSANGTRFETVDAHGTTIRLGTLGSADLLEWISQENDNDGGFRILIKALVDADGKRVPEDQRDVMMAAFKQKDNADNGRLIKTVLEMNGLRKADAKAGDPDLSAAIKND